MLNFEDTAGTKMAMDPPIIGFSPLNLTCLKSKIWWFTSLS